jgi:NAD(P)-dependent dehydrogenase (short-subunit alcohol dehydrogenase family)
MIRFEGFAGRSAVVTGAGGGMGLRIASDLRAAGATVAGIDLKDRPEALDDALYYQGDVSDDGFVARAIGAVQAETGRLDYLINAAGVLWFGRDRSLVEVELEVWNRVIAINLTGCMLTARHAIPLMRKSGGGAMVHFSSTQCLRGDDRPQDAYQVAKAGILALSKSIAIQFAAQKIRSNVILPSATESPMQTRWEQDPKLKQATASGIPLGRVGTTEDMANACLFLLSDAAAFITGTELLVDGGRMALP